MNYNQFSSKGLKLLSDPINSRAKLNTGTHCNYSCSFCYYLDKLNEVTSFEIIKKRAKKLYDFGITEIDLSGGESSIHRDWFKILGYCAELGFQNISCLSNGYKFADLNFTKKSFDQGLREILFSLHGWNKESHEKIVNKKGSFKKILQAIENCHDIGIKVRINCTVTGFNAPYLLEYTELINKIKPLQLNFLPLNYWEHANTLNEVSYEFLSKWIKKAIDKLDNKIEINVRYIPFCFMQEYEKYVVGIYQHIFDKRDWNIMAYDVDNLELKPVNLENYFKCAHEKRIKSYFKPKACFDCKYFYICDGVEHKLKNKYSIYPKTGRRICNVLFYKK